MLCRLKVYLWLFACVSHWNHSALLSLSSKGKIYEYIFFVRSDFEFSSSPPSSIYTSLHFFLYVWMLLKYTYFYDSLLNYSHCAVPSESEKKSGGRKVFFPFFAHDLLIFSWAFFPPLSSSPWICHMRRWFLRQHQLTTTARSYHIMIQQQYKAINENHQYTKIK